MSIRIKKPVAPSLEQLSRARVHQSHLFTVTNVSAAVLAAATVVLFGGGVVGTVMSAFELQNPTDATISTLLTSIGVAAGGIVTGLAAQWLAVFDDNAIEDHNFGKITRGFRRAANREYDNVQLQLVEALQDTVYDPSKSRLPNDVLGYIAILPDKVLEKLPAHIRLDAYRTQADLILSKYSGLCAHDCVEGAMIEERTMSSGLTMDEKAEEYRQMRNYVHTASSDRTLKVTPLPEHMRGRHVDKNKGYGFDDFMNDMTSGQSGPSSTSTRSRRDGNDDWIWWPTGSGSSGSSNSGGTLDRIGSAGNRTTGGFKTGGGFGGDTNFTTGGSMAAVPIPIPVGGSEGTGGGDMLGGLMDSIGGDSGGSGSSSSSDDNKGAAVLILIVIAVVVVAIAAKVTYDAVHKSYFKRAPVPHMNGVDLPLLTHSLKSIKGEVDKMYNRPGKYKPQMA